MPNLPFYDCNCVIGTRQWRHRTSPETLDDYLNDFEYYDIMAALVHHAYAVEYAQDYGNRRLLDEIADHPQLMPEWVVVPHWASEMAPPDELVAEMLQLGVRASRIYPASHGFSVIPEICGPLLSALQDARIPLFVDVAQLELNATVKLAKQYPELPVILCGVAWASDRTIFARFHEVPNLHLETWAFQGHRAYERFVNEFGSERLLFGTDLPNRSPGAARMMTCYEQISDQDRRNIAGGNLLRLLGNVQGAQGHPLPQWQDPPEHPEDDPIVAAVRAGRPLTEEFVLDAHAHLAHKGCMGVNQCAIAYNDPDGLVGSMDRMGVDIACASSWSGITYAAPDANDMDLIGVEEYPGRLLAYGCLNPNYPEMYKSEFERLFLGGKVIGYKPYPPRQLVPITDPRHELALQWCEDNEAPVLCHAGPVEHVVQLAPKYPHAKFLIAHSGMDWNFAEKVADAAKSYANIYAEITYTAILYGFCEFIVNEVGADKLLFGSDCVMRDIAPQLGWVAWARIPLEAKRRALGQNMADILKMPAARRKPIKH
ncbi:MAG: amidohydrolase family protein [Bacteroidota bacterium]